MDKYGVRIFKRADECQPAIGSVQKDAIAISDNMKGDHKVTEVEAKHWHLKDDDNIMVIDDDERPEIREYLELDEEIRKELVDLTKQWIRNRIGPARWRTKTFGESFDYVPMMREILEKYYLLNHLDCTLEELFSQETSLYMETVGEIGEEWFRKPEVERLSESQVKCPRCNYTWANRVKYPRECPNCGTRFFYDYWQKAKP